MALKCPSSGNRQPWKVYYTTNQQLYDRIRVNNYVSKDIYNFLIVTMTPQLFSKGEQAAQQPMLNAGIFLHSLVMSIHAFGMGSCLFQMIRTDNSESQYQRTKITANIPDNEDIVAMIGFGYLKEEYAIIDTHRKDIDEILCIF